MYSEKTSIKILLNNWVFVIFGLRAEKFGRSDEKPFVGLSKLHSTSAEEQFLDVSLEGTKFAQAFCSLSEIIGLFVWIFLSSLSELQPTCAADHFEVSLERRVIVWAFLVAERKYPIFGRKNLAGLLKLYFTCPEEQFQDIFSEWKHFWRMKNTRRIVKTTFNVFKGTVSGRFSGMMKLCTSFLVVVERNSSNLAWKFWQICQNCSLRVQRNISRFFGEKSNCLSVFGFWAKASEFWQKKIGRVAKTTFYVSRGTISGHFFWNEIFLKDKKHS